MQDKTLLKLAGLFSAAVCTIPFIARGAMREENLISPTQFCVLLGTAATLIIAHDFNNARRANAPQAAEPDSDSDDDNPYKPPKAEL